VYLEHTIVVVSLDRLGIDRLRQCQAALERTVAPLPYEPALALLLRLRLTLAPDGEGVAGDGDIDVVLVEPSSSA